MLDTSRVKWHTLVFLLALIILLVLTLQARRIEHSLVHANQSVLDSLELISTAKTTFSILQDVESGERGYVITGKPEYLAPYEAALAELTQLRGRLAVALQLNGPPRPEWFAELDELIERRLAISARNIQARREQGLVPAAERLVRAGGIQTMDRLRLLFDELHQREVGLLARDREQLQRQVQKGRYYAVGGGLLVLTLLLLAFVSVVRSLTVRAQLAYAAQATAARLEALLTAIPDDLYEIDAQKNVRGLSQHDALEAPLTESIAQALITELPEAADETGQFNWENGRGSTYEVRVVPTGMGDHLAIARDISEVLRAERMKSEFISTVSHELRTPLTAIRGALGMLVNGMLGETPAGQKPLLDIAYKNSERLVQLINDILDIEKLQAGRISMQLTLQAPTELLRQAIEYNEPYAQQYGVTLQLVQQVEEVLVRVDAERFGQVMANLLSNASKHSHPGGSVEVGVVRQGNWLEFSVQDHGRGIPDDFKPRVYERFAQADSSDVRRLGGTGLGLSITRSLVEQMGGDIGFESTLGVGTRFYFFLPAVEADIHIAPPVSPAFNTHQRCILVLEPVASAADQLSLLLERQGYSTRIATNTAEARRLLEASVYHALTLSPALPDEDCIAFIQALRERPGLRHLPVLVVNLQQADSPSGDPALRGGAVGVMDWLHKPIDPSRVLEVVNACIKQGGERPSILHVEDDADLRSLMASLLAPLGIDLFGAGTLAEARQQARARHHDLAILDLMLPDGDGSELIEELSEASPPTPVIIFSALDASESDNHQVYRRLVKSRHDSSELARLIQNMLYHWPAARSGTDNEEAP